MDSWLAKAGEEDKEQEQGKPGEDVLKYIFPEGK